MLTQNCPVGFRAGIRKISRIAGAALSAAMSLGVAAAQTQNENPPAAVQMHKGKASVAVHVIDPVGDFVPDASVILTNTRNHQEVTGQTDAQGNIQLSGLPAGEYRLTAKSSGFIDFSSLLVLHHWGTKKVDATLRVGMVGEVVIVPPHNIFSRLYHKVL